MTNHEFLDPARRRVQATFADGTAVTVDFDAGVVSVNRELKPTPSR
jgi:hypothetical protein